MTCAGRDAGRNPDHRFDCRLLSPASFTQAPSITAARRFLDSFSSFSRCAKELRDTKNKPLVCLYAGAPLKTEFLSNRADMMDHQRRWLRKKDDAAEVAKAGFSNAMMRGGGAISSPDLKNKIESNHQ